jgi:cytochrome oxidase Cu insertion factor (SCO1/SenC/PrrC family)
VIHARTAAGTVPRRARAIYLNNQPKTTMKALLLATSLIGGAALNAAPPTEPAAATAARPELELGRSAEYDYDPPAPGTYELPAIQPATDGTVLGRDRRPVRLHELFAGRVVVLSFIYTRCADPRACLRATGVLNQLQRLSREDPEFARRLLLVTLSFDPAHDTPEVMARYGRVFQSREGGAEWLFLTTKDQEQLKPLLAAYGQRVDRRKTPSPEGPYYHPLRVYLIDGAKQIRNIYSYGLLDPRLVMTDARTLLAETADQSPQLTVIPGKE